MGSCLHRCLDTSLNQQNTSPCMTESDNREVLLAELSKKKLKYLSRAWACFESKAVVVNRKTWLVDSSCICLQSIDESSWCCHWPISPDSSKNIFFRHRMQIASLVMSSDVRQTLLLLIASTAAIFSIKSPSCLFLIYKISRSTLHFKINRNESVANRKNHTQFIRGAETSASINFAHIRWSAHVTQVTLQCDVALLSDCGYDTTNYRYFALYQRSFARLFLLNRVCRRRCSATLSCIWNVFSVSIRQR